MIDDKDITKPFGEKTFGESKKPENKVKPVPPEKPREHMSEPGEELGSMQRAFDAINRVFPEDVTRMIDERLAKVPHAALLGVALGSLGVSATLAIVSEKKGWANFFGLWVPSLLFLSVYSKLAKLEQHRKVPTVH